MGAKKTQYFNSDIYYIDVKDNEAEVLEYLHSLDVHERGKIVSPEKSSWFKRCHYLRFLSVFAPSPKRQRWHWYAYTYCGNKERFQGEPLKLITLPELKKLLNKKTK